MWLSTFNSDAQMLADDTFVTYQASAAYAAPRELIRNGGPVARP